MKRTAIYIAMTLALAVLGQLPFGAADVGSLRPVEALVAAPGYVLRADTGDVGRGDSWQAAFADLKAAAPGSIFQGTVSFLLIEPGAVSLLPEILGADDLNPGCGVCLCEPGVDAAGAAAYLRAHPPEMNLRLLRAGAGELPILTLREGRYDLAKP